MPLALDFESQIVFSQGLYVEIFDPGQALAIFTFLTFFLMKSCPEYLLNNNG